MILEIFLAYFKNPLYSFTLMLNLISSQSFPNNLASSFKLWISKLKLLNFALKQMNLANIYDEFMDF